MATEFSDDISVTETTWSTGSTWSKGSRNVRHTNFSEAVLEAFHAELRGHKLMKLGMADKAAKEYGRTIAIGEEIFGEEHPMVLAFHEKLDKKEGWEKTAISDDTHQIIKAIRHEQSGNKLLKLGQNEKAVREFKKAMTIESCILGEDHPMTIAMQEKIDRQPIVLSNTQQGKRKWFLNATKR